MSSANHHWLLDLDFETYRKRFAEPNLGADLASQIALEYGYDDQLSRIVQGSSLVFRLGNDKFLKLTPPFFEDSIEAEVLAGKIIGDQLPLPIPRIIADGELGTWNAGQGRVRQTGFRKQNAFCGGYWCGRQSDSKC